MQEIDWLAISSVFKYRVDHPMLFNSAEFLQFFTVFFGIFLLLRKQRNLRTVYTLIFSLYFYYLSSGLYFFLLIFSTLVDFILGHYIYNSSTKLKRKLFLIFSIFINLGLLAYFKYTNFLIGIFNDVGNLDLAFHKVFLPVGISFYTFQTMSYSIDVYRRKLVPLSQGIKDVKTLFLRLNDFAFYVSFFPQLVAGPIVRAADFIPQIRQKLTLTKTQLGQALLLISGGLFKKAIISDYISVNFVDRVFENPTLYSGFENLMAVYGYAIQIYCDFSGYSDMAIGLALLMGFTLPENFRTPYKSLSIKEFWQRWHISLSSWLKDYLYFSLGGNRKGKRRTYVNLMLTMLLGGLWHGASWVFVIWGALHGLALTFDRFLTTNKKYFSNPAARALIILLLVHFVGQVILWLRFAEEPEMFMALTKGNGSLALFWISLFGLTFLIQNAAKFINLQLDFTKGLSRLFVFHFVALTWIFFRAGAPNNPMPAMQTTNEILGQILAAFNPELIGQVLFSYSKVLAVIALGFALHFLPTHWDKRFLNIYTHSPLPIQAFVLAFVIWLVIQISSSDVVPFIYFQF